MNFDYQTILVHYCDINEIPYHASRADVVTHLVQYPESRILYHTPYGRLFTRLQQLIRTEIDLEMMINSWDEWYPLAITTSIIDNADCIVTDKLVLLALQSKQSPEKIITIL